MDLDPFIFLAVPLVGAGLSALVNFVLEKLRRRIQSEPEAARARVEQSLDSQLGALSTTMREASQLITVVEAEIKARQDQIAQLSDEVKKQEQLAQMTAEAKDAVAEIFRSEFAREGRKARWISFGLNFVFFLIGSGVTLAVTYFVSPAYVP